MFVIQVTGSKAWSVEGVGEIVLAPGDVLYMPTGTAHSAAAQGRPSLHITMGILPVTLRNVLKRMLDDPQLALDDPLPVGFADQVGSTAAAAEALARRLHVVADMIKDIDARTVIGRER